MAYVIGGYPYYGYGQGYGQSSFNPYYGYGQGQYNYPYYGYGQGYGQSSFNPYCGYWQGSYNYPYFGNAYPTWGTTNFNKDRWLNNRPLNNWWW